MHIHAKKTPENEIKPANSSTDLQHQSKTGLNIVDNRPQALAQRKLQQNFDNRARSVGTAKEEVVQRVKRKEVEEESIGERVSRQNTFNKMTTRQKAMLNNQGGNPGAGRNTRNRPVRDQREKKREAVLRKLWTGTRPSFTPETSQRLLNNAVSQIRPMDGVTVYRAIDGGYYPLKRDRVGKEPFITFDHHKNWKEHVNDTAKPEYDGKITKKSAKKAYNDLSNLVLMSSSQNSSKSGPKGRFD